MITKGKLKFIPLGGVSEVTKNMFIYEYVPFYGKEEILIIDCGVGFPDSNMYGVDFVIPDISYLKNKRDRICGIVLTHGHEDHTAALPYILPKLKAPIFATKLTAALAEVRLDEANVKTSINICDTNKHLIRGSFDIEFVHVTHSIPDANHLIIRTPVGVFYHGSDFKFDWTPIDKQTTQVEKIEKAREEGILNLTSDCLGSDRPGNTPSEKVIEKGFEKEITNCQGKFIVTTQSSNISRIQQAINVSEKYGRRVCLLGRSIKRNVEVAEKLNYIDIPHNRFISEKDIKKYPRKQLTLIVTGSQGEVESALSRIVLGDHQFVEINPGDKVVFSADPIPGNEEAVHSLIDDLVSLEAEVSYSEVNSDLHVSGHGSQDDLKHLLLLTKPKYIIPIGGTKRHMYHYRVLAEKLGFPKNNLFMLEEGDVVEFEDSQAKQGKNIGVETIMVDGLGIGDVGNVVLRDRHRMAQDGIVVVILPFDKKRRKIVGNIDIISRGFVYMKESGELINQTKKAIFSVISRKKRGISDFSYFKKLVEDVVEKFLYEKTHRRPMVIVVLVEI